MCFFFFFKQKTAYEMRISDWSSDVCSSDLLPPDLPLQHGLLRHQPPVHEPARTDDDARRTDLPDHGPENAQLARRADAPLHFQIGRASCRERVCPSV